MILGLIVMIEKFILKQKLAARISLKLITFPFIDSLQERDDLSLLCIKFYERSGGDLLRYSEIFWIEDLNRG